MVIEDVCNMALSHIGKPNITSVNENSVEAINCKNQYNRSRILSLSYSPWTFATKTAYLAQVNENPHSDVWEFAYDIPNDSLNCHMRVLEESESPLEKNLPHDIHLENGKLYCNISNVRLFYVFDQTNINSWPMYFTNAVSYNLAYQIAPNLLRSKRDIKDVYETYRGAIDKAVELDAASVTSTYAWTAGGYLSTQSVLPARRQADGSTIWG